MNKQVNVDTPTDIKPQTMTTPNTTNNYNMRTTSQHQNKDYKIRTESQFIPHKHRPKPHTQRTIEKIDAGPFVDNINQVFITFWSLMRSDGISGRC